jgi:hypothetical protein
VDTTEERIREVLPRCPFLRESYAFWFPISQGSEYGFSAWFLESGELSIDAYLSSSEQFSRSLDFWYHSFEEDEFEAREELVEEFQSELIQLLTHETRIVQRKRPRAYDFACEVRLEDWTPVYRQTLSRESTATVPAISSRERTYRAYPDSDWLGALKGKAL